jgi:hypothetical protein
MVEQKLELSRCLPGYGTHSEDCALAATTPATSIEAVAASIDKGASAQTAIHGVTSGQETCSVEWPG